VTPVRLRAAASTLERLFEDAAGQLLPVLISPDQVGETLREKIVLDASSPEALLQQWITSLLNLAAAHKIAYRFCRCRVAQSSTETHLTAEVIGELVDPLRHEWRIDPRQVNCSQMSLSQDPAGYEAVFFIQKH